MAHEIHTSLVPLSAVHVEDVEHSKDASAAGHSKQIQSAAHATRMRMIQQRLDAYLPDNLRAMLSGKEFSGIKEELVSRVYEFESLMRSLLARLGPLHGCTAAESKPQQGRLPAGVDDAGGEPATVKKEPQKLLPASGHTEAEVDADEPADNSQALVPYQRPANLQEVGIDPATAARIETALARPNPENMHELIGNAAHTALGNLQHRPQVHGNHGTQPGHVDSDAFAPMFADCLPPPAPGEREPTLEEIKAAFLVYMAIQQRGLNFLKELFDSTPNNQNHPHAGEQNLPQDQLLANAQKIEMEAAQAQQKLYEQHANGTAEPARPLPAQA